MKKQGDTWYITSIHDLFGWMIVDQPIDTANPNTFKLKIKHKTTGEDRTVLARKYVIPLESIELLRDKGNN